MQTYADIVDFCSHNFALMTNVVVTTKYQFRFDFVAYEEIAAFHWHSMLSDDRFSQLVSCQ